MPVTLIERTANTIITRIEATALKLTGADLYDRYSKQYGTQHLSITVLGGGWVFVEDKGTEVFVGGRQFRINRDQKALADYVPSVYDYIKIKIKYQYGSNGFDANQKLTRVEFVNEVLGIWEALLAKASSHSDEGKKAIEKLEAASAMLSSTYSFSELLPGDGETFAGFRNLFNVPKVPNKNDVFGLGDFEFASSTKERII